MTQHLIWLITYNGDMADTLQHLAIIMDGNGRWASKRNLPRIMGHRAGVKAVREVIEGCVENDIAYLTLYAFSTENWQRPAEEVSELMNLLRRYIKSEFKELHEKGVRLRFIGQLDKLSDDIQEMLADATEKTAENTRLNLQVALSYGARQEYVDATRAIISAVQQNQLSVDSINSQTIQHYLYTADIPDPDVIFRTSGEQRLSNFMLWQAAYSELMFTEKLWPNITRQDIADVKQDFLKRERRFGGL